jgi:NAD(P)H-flavin reductase
MLPLRVRITRRRRDTADTFIMELGALDGAPLPAFQPGQFNMVSLFGTGEVPLSIAGSPGKQLVHTARAVGTVTRAMGRLRPGGELGVRGPFGTGWPLSEATGKDVLLVAGGIGIAALHSAIRHLLARGKEYRRVTLLYGARTSGDILYRHELERWRRRGLQVAITVDRARSDWKGHVGVVTNLLPRAMFDPLSCVALICGPEIMMRFTARELIKLGVPETSLFLSMERNMKCGIGHCGHCQFGPVFICKDGPVIRYDRLREWFKIREL